MSSSRWSLNELLITLIAFPVLGVIMGGIYSVPAMHMTNCRDPSYTVFLATGLSTTVIGLGLLFGVPYIALFVIWAVAIAVLGARRWVGPLDHNLERFWYGPCLCAPKHGLGRPCLPLLRLTRRCS